MREAREGESKGSERRGQVKVVEDTCARYHITQNHVIRKQVPNNTATPVSK